MKNRVQELAEKINVSCDDFVGEMRKRGCSEPTSLKIWQGEYEHFDNIKDNDMNLSNLRKSDFRVESCNRNFASEIKVRR